MATRKHTNTHTHATRNAITLVWGSLRLAPIKGYSTMACSDAMIQHSFVSMSPALSPLPLLTHHTPVTKAGVGSLATLHIHKPATRIIITHKPHYISLSHIHTPHTRPLTPTLLTASSGGATESKASQERSSCHKSCTGCCQWQPRRSSKI